MAQGPPTSQFGQMGLGGTAVCVTKVELRIRCAKLVNKDLTSKSDPMVLLQVQDMNREWIDVGRTENVKNDLNPQFMQTISIDYCFEQVQQLRFRVYDVDNATLELSDDDFLGQTECTLAAVVAGTPYRRGLMNKKGVPMKESTITVVAEELGGKREFVVMLWRGIKLDKKDTFGKSDPFLEFHRLVDGGSYQLIHKTEIIENTLNPTWKELTIPVNALAAGDNNRELLIRCYDFDATDDNDLIGQFTTTPAELIGCATESTSRAFSCINPKKTAKKKYVDSGKIELLHCKITRDYSFLDYIFGGMQLNFSVAVDFTASNGNPTEPGSLHYINPEQPNEYMQAIYAVGNVIQDYDTDKMFPALGFGARLPPDWVVSHEFALNFNPANPFCAGVAGVVQAYQSCITQVQLYGPTNVAPMIDHVARFGAAAAAQPGASQYYVLLVLTDGEITDMAATTEAVVRASALPVSVIIIGVGPADFSRMKFLDADRGALVAPSGRRAARDIVQFVPFRRFARASKESLARAVLAEVPKQVVEYFSVRDIPPNNPNPQPAA